MAASVNRSGNDSSGKSAGIQRNLSDYLLAIRARWMWGALAGGLAAAAFFFSEWGQEPLYESRAKIRFYVSQDIAAGDRAVRMSAQEAEMRLRNYVIDMTGNNFQRQLIDSLSDEERRLMTQDYVDPKTGAQTPIEAIYRGAFDIRQSNNNHFNLTFTHRNPRAAFLLIRKFGEEYSQYLEDQNRRSNEAAIRFLRLQVEDFRLKVERGEKELQLYQNEHDDSLAEERNFVDQRLQELRAALSEQELALINFETYVSEIEKAEAEGRPLQELPFIREYGQVETFVSNLVTLRQQRQNLAVRYGSRHPRMIENSAAMDSAQKGLDEAIRQAVNKVRIDYEAKNRAVARLAEEFATQEGRSKSLDEMRIEYRNMQTRLATDRQLFVEMLQRLNETQIQSKLRGPRMELIDEPSGPPSAPVSPNEKKIILSTAGIFFALLIGFPIGLDFIDGRLRTRQAVEDIIGRNYLGQVSKIKGKNVDPYEVALLGKPKNIVEALRIVHSQFQMALPSRSGQVIVVSSLIPGEGKSFMSISLATLMAKHHRQVLVIDCDLRRPSIIRGLEKGGRELRRVREVHELMQLGTDEPSIIEEVREGLHVMSIGENPDDPTEIFEDVAFKQMVQRFRQEYDMVILDTPPAGVFSDAAMLGPLSDGYVIVLRHNNHSVRKVRNVIRDLEKNNVSVLGIAFNHVVGKFSRGTDDYHRGKYYSYYSTGGKKIRRSKRKTESTEATAAEDGQAESAEESTRASSPMA